jgi:hypothetical protein
MLETQFGASEVDSIYKAVCNQEENYSLGEASATN